MNQPAPPQGYRTAQISRPPAPSDDYATFWQRFAAFFFDVLVVGIGYSIVIAAFGLEEPTVSYGRIVLLAAYFGIGNGLGGTPFKRLSKLEVVDIDTNEPIGIGRGFLRYIGSMVSGMLLFLGYLWMIWDGDKQTWHDKFAKSVVVKR